jgi:hypothetical protein
VIVDVGGAMSSVSVVVKRVCLCIVVRGEEEEEEYSSEEGEMKGE